jgi:hypothetical protein
MTQMCNSILVSIPVVRYGSNFHTNTGGDQEGFTVTF